MNKKCDKCGQPFPVRRLVSAGDRIIAVYMTEEDSDYLTSLLPRSLGEAIKNKELEVKYDESVERNNE